MFSASDKEVQDPYTQYATFRGVMEGSRAGKRLSTKYGGRSASWLQRMITGESMRHAG
jgi:hypothetical protein